MNIGEIFRESWRITTRCWKLWLLMLVVFFAFVPTLVLTGGITGAATLLSQDLFGFQTEFLPVFGSLSPMEWILILLAVLVLVMVSAAVSWIFQAAAMRASIMAAEGSPISMKNALGLGHGRFIHILKLSVMFGFVLAFLGLMPVVPDLLLEGTSFEAIFKGAAQISMLPVNTILGLVVLLVLMSVALEEVTPRRSFGRAWQVFKKGWWGFLFVMAATLALSILPVLLLVPLLFLAIIALVLETGWMLFLAATLVLAPLSLGVSLFSAVFTLVMYTLIYRSAAKLLNGSFAQAIPQRRSEI
jgi:hypothetical protein